MPKTSKAQTPKGKVRHEAKFQCILNAALDVFAERGFHHATISHIARAAGVADGTIYLYFKNKDDLMGSLFDVKLAGLAKQLRCAIADIDDAGEKLARIIDYHLELAQTQSNLLALMRQQMHGGMAPWGRLKRPEDNPYLAEWMRVIGDGIANKALKTKLSAATSTQLLYGALDHACHVWAAQECQSPLKEVWAFMRGMLLGTEAECGRL